MAGPQRQPSPFSASPLDTQPPHGQSTAQAPSKRDVRRNRIMERLQGMMDAFAGNANQHYRAQLHAVQVDMTLVLRADPYKGIPLEESSADMARLVEQTVDGAAANMDEAARRDFDSVVGTRYREFVRQVNDSLEQRDAELTALHNNYASAMAALESDTHRKLHQAGEEHAALASTIRQRLIHTITKKRAHLLRDKESLDIADSNTLLMHPIHFSINNPGSPGGNGVQNRKTRHLRHRAVSPGPGTEGENGGVKRKRKAGAMDGEEGGNNGSPAPAFRPLPPPDNLGGGRSPFKDAREKNVYAQYEAPAYSLERLFTEKELAMATETAKLATYRYFYQSHPPPPPDAQQQHQQQQQSNGNTGAPSIDGQDVMDTTADGDEAAARPTTEAAAAASPPPAAPEMERTTSHQVLTRGGARANPLAALSDLATAAASASASTILPLRDNPFAPVVPSYHAVTRAEKAGAPAPPGVSSLDVENDLEMMRQPDPVLYPNDRNMDDEEDELERRQFMRRQLLDQALGVPNAVPPYRLPLLETGPALIGRGVERLLGTGFAPTRTLTAGIQGVGGSFGGGASMAVALAGRLGGEAMSRTTSAAGGSDAGAGQGPGMTLGLGGEVLTARGKGRRLV